MVIDITRLLGRSLRGLLPTGVDRVSLEYVRHFGARAQALVRFGGRWVVAGRNGSTELFAALLEPEEASAIHLRWLVARRYVGNWHGPPTGSVLMNTGHSGLERTDYARRVQRHGLRALYFLHDLIPITHPEYCRAGEADRHRRRLETMLKTAAALVVNSFATARALHEYTAAQEWPLPPCTVAPLAPGRLPPPAAGRLLPERYFVVLGTIEPRKNHLLLLHLWRQLVAELGAAAPRLVLIGRRGWECEQVTDLLERCEALRGMVLERSACGDAELASWLAYAQAVLFPSFVEGYGLPVVEALLLEVPVIASDLPVFRELAGDVPEYLDPLDGRRWKQLILEYGATDSAARRAQQARIAGWTTPTWAAHFELVEHALAHCRAGG